MEEHEDNRQGYGHGDFIETVTATPLQQDANAEIVVTFVEENESQSGASANIDKKVEDAIAEDLVNKGKGVENETGRSNWVDAETNTSQTLLILESTAKDVELKECASGSSQPQWTVDCAIQTSQELLPPAPLKIKGDFVQNEDRCMKNLMVNEIHSSVRPGSNAPILFPRLRGQNCGPEIPTKMRRVTGKPGPTSIYSSVSEIEEDFEECDKENGGIFCMNNLKNLNQLNTLPQTETRLLCNPAFSRGPLLRLGLSKKARFRKPLHVRSFQAESVYDE